MAATTTVREFVQANELLGYLMDEIRQGSIFRGQSEADWPLLPSAWRENAFARVRAVYNRGFEKTWPFLMSIEGRTSSEPRELAMEILGNDDDDSIDRVRDLIIRLNCELLGTQKFKESCDKAALSVPGMAGPGDRAEISLKQVNLDLSEVLTPVPLFEITSSFALAQHMGLRTRLLDFSDSSLKAAYFASSVGTGLLQPDTRMCIWVATPPLMTMHARPNDPYPEIGVRLFRVLRAENRYLHAQDGLFLLCNARANHFFLMNGRWPHFGEIMDGWTLEQLTLPSSESRSLLQKLDRMGINEITMKPSYETAARLAQQYMN